MTSENLYDAALREALDKYKQTTKQSIASISVPIVTSSDIPTLMRQEKLLVNMIAKVKSTHIPPPVFDAKCIIEEHFSTLEKSVEQERSSIEDKAKSEKQKRVNEFNQSVDDMKAHNESLVTPFRKKHEELLAYRKELKHTFEHYDISPLDIELSDNLSPKEFHALIDKSLAVCKKYTVEKDNTVFDRIAKPLKDEKNLQSTLCYVILLLAIAYVAIPLLAVPLFYTMCKSIHTLYRDIEALRIANALMTQIDYNRFVDPSSKKEVKQVSFDDIETEREQALSELKDYSVDKAKALEQLNASSTEIASLLSKAHNDAKLELANLLKGLETQLETVKGKLEDFRKNYKPFPSVCSTSQCMSRSFVTTREEGAIDVTETFPLSNFTFDTTNHDAALKAVKLFLCNALLSVVVKNLVVEIFDPINMCADFTEFLSTETSDYIKPNSTDLTKLMSELNKDTQENVIRLDDKTIDEFNHEAEVKEMVPLNYKLVIFVSGFETLFKEGQNVAFLELCKFSASKGIQFWFMHKEQIPGTLWFSNTIITRKNFIQYTRDLGNKCMEIYQDMLVTYRPKGLYYPEKFGPKFFPEEKWWTYDTIKGIAMHYGLENGDPTKCYPLYIGDDNVHALMGGATGSGKSVAINQNLISLITMYPPSELQIVFIDFKNVEAAKFTKGWVTEENRWMTDEEEEDCLLNEKYFTRLSYIPHLHIISGTTDGEYALSVFEFLDAEMQRRQKIINKAGVTKIENLRKNILADYCKLKGKKCTWYEMRQDWDWYKPNVYDVYGDLPRLIVVFDEFQVMFNSEVVENKIIDKINAMITKITKLARAMGAHFWFTSQSMKGTMSKDTMGNFSMRAALRCSKEVSSEILGNPASGTITQKVGLLYTNCSAGEDPKDNKLWKVPYMEDEDINNYIVKVNDLLKKYPHEGHRMAEFYDEKTLVPSVEMSKWYKTYPETFNDPGVLILGERANYSENKAPYTTTLVEDGGENILCAAFEREDMMNLGLTLINNVREKSNVKMIINCQDRDTYELMEIDKIVDPTFLDLSKPSQSVPELVDAFSGMISARREMTGDIPPVYVFLVQWERAPGVCVDVNYKLQDKFKDCLRDGPSVGIHFVFISKEKLEMPRAFASACNHRICGAMIKDAMFFINTVKVEKLPNKSENNGVFAMYEYGSTLAKFRIYQHTFTRTIKEREVVLK